MGITQSVLKGQEVGFWFVCYKGRIWLPEGEVPEGTAQDNMLVGLKGQIIGTWRGCSCWLVCHEKPQAMVSIRQLLNEKWPPFQMVGRAVQLAEFYRSHLFCGYCGTPMSISKTEWCCLCPCCHQRYYPQICPSIIVAIRKNNQIL